MELTIKNFDDLTKNELYAILRLRNEVFIIEQNCNYLDCDGKDLNAYHLLYRDKNEIIGYLRILNKGISYKEHSLGRVIVKKEHRGKNISKVIINEAINFIKKELNGNNIRISAQSHLQNVYKNFGFQTVSEEYLEDDIPHVEMLYKN